jgi:RNA-directed DNA polymerase
MVLATGVVPWDWQMTGINAQVRGWINYYGAFYRSELHSVALRIDQHLVRWAMRKFKRLKGNPKGAWAWWHAAHQRSPRLFVHWNLSPTSSRPARAG